MSKITNEFYSEDGELTKLLNKTRSEKVPLYLAELLIKQLTSSIKNILSILRDQPENALAYLKISVDSKVSHGEFKSNINAIYERAINNNCPQSVILGDELTIIRQLYTKDRDFISSFIVSSDDDKDKILDSSSTFISTLNKFHIEDVNKRIKSEISNEIDKPSMRCVA